MAYKIYYIDSGDRVCKTEGGFDTLESIYQSNAQLIRVRKRGRDILNIVGGALDDIAKLKEKGFVDTKQSHKAPGDRLPGMDW